jgi:hypothetical protein
MPVNHARGESAGANEEEAAAALKPRDFVAGGLLAVLFLGARLRQLDASCLWFDEIFGVHAARHELGALLDFVAVDVIHPPLFYLLLKSWIALGGSEGVWWLRLFPVLTATAAIVPVLLLCRELRLRPLVGQLALLLMCVNGFLIQYAREVRMYSLLFLLAACSLWLFARFAQSDNAPQRRNGLALFAVNLALVYTHYFGWLLVGHELIFLVVWQRRKVKLFALMLAALVVCYSPWVLLLWRAAGGGGGAGKELIAQNIGWVVAPRLPDIIQPYLLLHEPFRFRRNTHEPLVLSVNTWLALILFVPPFVALGWRWLRPRRAEAQKLEAETAQTAQTGREAGRFNFSRNFALTFLIFFSTAPVIVAFLLARVLPHSIWGTRHLIIIAPVYLLLAATALVSLRPFWLATTIKLLLACWLTLAAMLWLTRRDDTPPIWCAWETLARQASRAETTLQSDGTPDEVKIYAFEDLAAYHLWYALRPSPQEQRFSIIVIKDYPGVVEDKAFFLPRGFPEVTTRGTNESPREEHFWVAFRVASGNAMEHPYLKMLSAQGYEMKEQFAVAASGQKAFLVSVRRR